MEIVILHANSSYTEEQVQEFYNIVQLGGQIPIEEEILKKNIRNCELLAFALIDKEVAGIAAIKNPQRSYKRKVFEGIADADLFHFEFGYCVTLPQYRGKQVASTLTKRIVDEMHYNMWATTQSPAMKKILLANGFKEKGIYKSKFDILCLLKTF